MKLINLVENHPAPGQWSILVQGRADLCFGQRAWAEEWIEARDGYLLDGEPMVLETGQRYWAGHVDGLEPRPRFLEELAEITSEVCSDWEALKTYVFQNYQH